MRVIAFDIDGTLTDTRVLESYRDLSTREEFVVGIVTARPTPRAVSFVEEHDLQTDFLRTGQVKVITISSVKNTYPDADSYSYVGNTFRDRLATNLTGWEWVSWEEVVEDSVPF